ncbi:MAG: RepB family DNA primase [Acidobacteriota bacterium]|jgi:hypothetical protein|nr:RepB family DNA primase [Acidobacteriota bacterium]
MDEYIRDRFTSTDWLAFLCKGAIGVKQRILTAREASSPLFKAWLETENRLGSDIYIGMNTLNPGSRTRTRRDIADIRHIYLVIDRDGRGALTRIMEDSRVPMPNCVLATSPGKFQVVWKATGFTPEEAGRLQKAMAPLFGADRAATDVTRVLRLPGFYNRKYDKPYMVGIEKIHGRAAAPSDFKVGCEWDPSPAPRTPPGTSGVVGAPTGPSRSERDWATVCRRIEKGESPAAVQGWLERARRDKPDPGYYAELIVRKAVMRCQAAKAASGSFRTRSI